MHTTAQLAKAVMRKNNLTSGYSLGKLLGATPKTGRNWLQKTSTFNEENALKCAQILSLNPKYVLACTAAERSNCVEAKAYWHDIAKQLKDEAN